MIYHRRRNFNNGALIPLPQSNNYLITGRRMCLCKCIRRPNYFVPSITGLVSSEDDYLTMLVESVKLNAKISGSLASVDLVQVFSNQNQNPVECVYKFPLDPHFVVTGVSIKMDDKIITTDIMEKEKAKSKYDDTVAQGNTAVRVEYNEELPDIIQMNIGFLPENKSVEITVSIATTCFVIKHGHFSLIFPYNFLPTFIRNTSGINKMVTKFSSCITLDSASEVVSLSTSHQMKYTKDETSNLYTIELEETEDFESRDIVVSYSTENIRKTSVRLFEHPDFKNELAAHIFFIPKISKETDEKGTDEEEKISETTIYEPDANNDDSELASGEFIFILDRSGSMEGTRIKLVIEALVLFLQSLPEDSLFNIISFGTSYHKMFPNSVKYNEETLNEAINQVKKFRANLGSTEILKPLKHVFKQEITQQYPRNVFLLTDGVVSDPEEVIQVFA